MTIDPTKMKRQRLFFFAAVAIVFSAGFCLMFRVVGAGGWNAYKICIVTLFGILFVQLVFGAALAVTGFFLQWRQADTLRINNTLPPDFEPANLAKTAIVIPIYNEDVGRVFRGLRAMVQSLDRTGHGDHFHFFILSDSNDPNHWVDEEKTWLELCKELNGLGRIFYRKRRVTLNHKSGNIADFCRRWGAHYRYMIVLDADSIMTGPAFVRLTALMEKNRSVGIIQTAPRFAMGTTVFQRIQQFAAHLYSPLFITGANFWQLGNGAFWGHNAIVRLQPFIEHCALPELKKVGALGGRILSHDTVEAALMQKAGYGVWVAYDLPGSYEEAPPDLIETLKRDRRWCSGNMQHILVLFWRELKTPSRIHILFGILSYANSPLWLLFLLLGTFEGWRTHSVSALTSTLHAGSWAGPALFWMVVTMLFLPKLLGVFRLLAAKNHQRTSGSAAKIFGGALIETLSSMFIAPILMLFYTRFVVLTLTGLRATWGSQKRGAAERTWPDIWKAHGVDTFIGLAWGGLVWWLAPQLFPWMLPILLGIVFSAPLSRVSGSSRVGEALRRHGWFLTPEEVDPPLEMKSVEESLQKNVAPFFQQSEYAFDYGLLQAVLDPYVHSIHVSLLRQREEGGEKAMAYAEELGAKLLAAGPASLTAEQRLTLLWDADALIWLHQSLWMSPNRCLHDWWLQAMRYYNNSFALYVRQKAA